MGKWAAGKLGRKGFIAASLADAGYDAVYAFRRGFESAGGSIADTDVTHVDPSSSRLGDLFNAVRAVSPSFVYAQYTGARAVDFVKAYASSGLNMPLVGASLLVDDYALGAVGSAAKGVRSAASWTLADPTANQTFANAYRSRTGRSADPFAVLGDHTGNLVVAGFQNANRLGLAPSRLAAALAGMSIASPRGTRKFDGSTNAMTGSAVHPHRPGPARAVRECHRWRRAHSVCVPGTALSAEVWNHERLLQRGALRLAEDGLVLRPALVPADRNDEELK